MTPGTAVSIWVGIDGYNPLSPPVVQAGIDVEYGSDGTQIYRSWTEVSCSLSISDTKILFNLC